MIVWGGNGNTGGRYNPGTDTWTATSTTNAPIDRILHTAVWTGSEMIVWGGQIGYRTYTNTGGRYNPSTDSWAATSTTNAPTARGYHTTVWTGSEMIVWGGYRSAPLARIAAADTIPARIVGQPPAPSTHPITDFLTRQSGPAMRWSFGVDMVEDS